MNMPFTNTGSQSNYTTNTYTPAPTPTAAPVAAPSQRASFETPSGSFSGTFPSNTTPTAPSGSMNINNGPTAPLNGFTAPIVNGDVFNNTLLELSWRGIPFPARQFKESGSQDMSIHKYPDRDGAKVEPTGRNPSKFHISALLTNNIYPSSNETWKQGTLYPATFTKLINLFYNESTLEQGFLIHPDKGAVRCRILSWDYQYTGHEPPRDGVILEIECIECIDDSSLPIITSAVNDVGVSNNSSLDNPPFSPPNMNLGQFLSAIAGFVNNIVSYPNAVIGSLNSQLSSIESSAQQIIASPISAIPQTYNSAISIAQQQQGSLVNGTVSGSVAYWNSTFNLNTPPSNGNNPQFQTSSFNPSISKDITGNVSLNVDPNALLNLYKSAFSLNNTSSGNGAIFMDKTENFISNLIYYYNSLNNVSTSSIKLQLDLLLGKVQQVKKQLFSSIGQNTTYYYTVPTNISILSLVSTKQQNLDEFLSMNPFITKTYYIKAGTTVNLS